MTESLFDDCGHPDHISKTQITECLGGTGMVDVPLPLIAFVAGKPAPQGSKKALHHKQSGKIVTMESSKAVKPWRESIRHALLDDQGLPRATFTGAVLVELRFVMPRPASTPKRSTPPAVKRPDIDKLARAVLDAVSSAGVWKDDSQVTQLSAMKRLADLDETAGLHIAIRDA
jgi:crossover junction endodeoxyribonuclease RusA